MTINLTTDQEEYFKDHYGKCRSKEIAKKLNLPLWKVYKIGTELGLNKKLNPILEINEIQNQIILGGILGDGSFKKNGSNYYYRECHAIGEKNYLYWKFEQMYNLTTKKIHKLPSRYGHSSQVEFQTINSPSFLPYIQMSKKEVINNLTELGYLIWMLDDGWRAHHNQKYSYICVASGTLTDEELQLILVKGLEFGLSGKVIGKKEKFISFGKCNNYRIKEIALKFFSPFMDIMVKKINRLQC